MKKFALLVGVALLASCGAKQDAAAPDAMASADATMPMDAGAAPAAAPTPGSYDVTMPDGTARVTTLMADGTYIDRDSKDKVVEKGTMAMKDGKTCFTPTGGKEECMTDSAIAADGSFTSTSADGKVTKVKPHVKK